MAIRTRVGYQQTSNLTVAGSSPVGRTSSGHSSIGREKPDLHLFIAYIENVVDTKESGYLLTYTKLVGLMSTEGD